MHTSIVVVFTDSV